MNRVNDKYLYVLYVTSQSTGADPGYVKRGGGKIQKGGRMADITRK